PLVPPLSIVATPMFNDPQVTLAVRSCCVVSEKMPVAWYCTCVPFAIEGLFGLTLIDCSTAAVTVSVVLPVMPACLASMSVVPVETVNSVEPLIVPPGVVPAALIVAGPGAIPSARPLLPAVSLTVATAPSDVLQVAASVRFCVVPFE